MTYLIKSLFTLFTREDVTATPAINELFKNANPSNSSLRSFISITLITDSLPDNIDFSKST